MSNFNIIDNSCESRYHNWAWVEDIKVSGKFQSLLPHLWESDYHSIDYENLDSALTKAVNNYYISKKLGDMPITYVHCDYDEDDNEIPETVNLKISDFDIDIFAEDNCNASSYCGGIEIDLSITSPENILKNKYNYSGDSPAELVAKQIKDMLNNDEEFYNTIIDDAYMELI